MVPSTRQKKYDTSEDQHSHNERGLWTWIKRFASLSSPTLLIIFCQSLVATREPFTHTSMAHISTSMQQNRFLPILYSMQAFLRDCEKHPLPKVNVGLWANISKIFMKCALCQTCWSTKFCMPMEKLWRLTRQPIFCTDCPKFCMENRTLPYTQKTNKWMNRRMGILMKATKSTGLPVDLKNRWEAWSLSSPSFAIDKHFCTDCPEFKFCMKNKTLPYTHKKKTTNERTDGHTDESYQDKSIISLLFNR